ncbi:MAG TPA: hypothetical protein VFS30_03060 [Dehalococcoidia bacterium]|nr:hypothetical protein [Dehalococcoidia bacterium]
MTNREGANDERRFRTVRATRLTPFHGILHLAFLILIVAGGTELRILGLLGFVQMTSNLLARHGWVLLSAHEIRIRTHIRTTISFSDIVEVKKYEAPPLPEWKRWLYGPGFEDIQMFFAVPAVGLYLRKPRWILCRGLPPLLRYRIVRVYLDREDEEEFLLEVATRMKSSHVAPNAGISQPT